ncbi:MAG: PhzF family phenazine biosynthesis isomerase [Chromatiales bacterium]|nr:PhzF family phenazine biosynthesis isomerase [Chromatiales bacterium]
MQRVAREMNYSETVFLGPPESGGDACVRIFTPGKEVPFAGHLTVGSAIYVASTLEHLPTDGTRTVVLEENVGHVPVDVRFRNGDPVSARFTTAVLPEHRPLPRPRCRPGAAGGAGAFRLHPTLRPEMVSCGLAMYVIPIASLGAIRRAVLDTALLEAPGGAPLGRSRLPDLPRGRGSGRGPARAHVRPGRGRPRGPGDRVRCRRPGRVSSPGWTGARRVPSTGRSSRVWRSGVPPSSTSRPTAPAAPPPRCGWEAPPCS